MITKGQVVKFKKEWMDKGDETLTFIAIEDESLGRVRVKCLLGLAFDPTQIVNVSMIET